MFKAETLSLLHVYVCRLVHFDFRVLLKFIFTTQPSRPLRQSYISEARAAFRTSQNSWPGLSRSRVTVSGSQACLPGARPVSRGTVTGNPPAAQRVRAGPHSDPAQYTVRGTVTGGRPAAANKKTRSRAGPAARLYGGGPGGAAAGRFKSPASTVTSTLPGPGWSHALAA
jgi:hypothetical protein